MQHVNINFSAVNGFGMRKSLPELIIILSMRRWNKQRVHANVETDSIASFDKKKKCYSQMLYV